MKTKIRLFLGAIMLAIPCLVSAQSCANYSVTRNTGITYTSLSGNGPSHFSWRNTSSNQDDDNRSYQEPIGFDFWYLGIRYTQFSASLNGTIDFSSSTSDGNNGGAGPYGPNYNNPFTTANISMLALAPFYDDIWTSAGGTTPVASSIFYKVSGAAPNRVLTVEWQNFEKWNSSTGSVNFQVKLHETSGVIEFLYGAMTAGTGSFTYACGINGNWTTGSPGATALLTQQTANTTSFNSTASNNLSVLPASNSKLVFTPPVPNAIPTGLSFTAISKTGMTLHWNNTATNEVGYAIYHSMDNIDFIYAGETAANATSLVIAGLLPSTTYYWRVHAVTEGDLGTALSGTQATLPAGIITSLGSGNWNSMSTWDCGCIPTLGDDVTIGNGHTVTLNANGFANMLNVGQGTSGSLIIGNNGTGRILTIDSDIIVHPGATITTGATAATHSIILDDDIINNGTFDLAPSATRSCDITFSNFDDSDQFVTGTGGVTNFHGITINMGSSENKVEISSTHFTAASNFLTLINGKFKLSTAATLTAFSGNVTIPISAGIWLNHAGASLSTTGGSITLLGSIQVSAGNFTIGNAADNNLTFDGGSLIMEGGAMNIAGRFDNLGITALTNLSMTGGTITVATIGSTTAGIASFSIPEVGSTFNISGGTIIIRRPGAGNLGYLNTGGTINSVTGGTLQIGDALTPASQTFQINSSIPIYNLTVSNGIAATAILSANPLTVKNNCSISAGTFNSNSIDLTIGGNFTNNATFTSGTSTTTFNGSSGQTIGGTTTTTFNNLTINKSSGLITMLNNIIVNAVLNFSSGKISLDNNNLSIGASGSVAGASANNYAIATGTGTFIQHIANGGSKTFPVGTSTAYLPATIALTAGSTADNIHISVMPLVHSQGTGGNTVVMNAVSATWLITEETIGNSNATITLQWPASSELNGFNRLFSHLAHYTAGEWDYGGSPIAASGTNPYTVTRSGFTSFSPFAVAMLYALPVTWLDIDGHHDSGNNHIGWSTATEHNNHYFAVEYSTNGSDYSEAGRVTAAGNSTGIKHYKFIHANVSGPVIYYRIKQVDLDARSSYSKVIKVTTGPVTVNRVTVGPNPASDLINVSISAEKRSTVQLVIMDMSGKRIHATSKNILPGNNTVLIDVSKQMSGIYLLKLIDSNGKEQVIKFMKQ